MQPENGWEVDLEHMASLIDSNTRAIVVTNPSNPCGSNFSREHVVAIAALAAEHKVPIIADEIYADMVFEGM
jgi:tyrosine aminotransferase